MNARWQDSRKKPHIGRLAMEKYKIRADIETQIYEKAKKLDDKRWDELNAYATSVDATMLLALHRRYRFKKKVLREIWEDMIRLRVQMRLNFRDGGVYVEQATGRNIEDTAIFHDLNALGVDIRAWESEDIEVDEKTGEVSFRGKH